MTKDQADRAVGPEAGGVFSSPEGAGSSSRSGVVPRSSEGGRKHLDQIVFTRLYG